MGCEISSHQPLGPFFEKKPSRSTVSPIVSVRAEDLVTPVKQADVHQLPTKPHTKYRPITSKKQSITSEEDLIENSEQQSEESVDDLFLSYSFRPGSVASMMENRPPSGISHASFTRVYRPRNQTRTYTIDTSRSKSNQPVVSLCSKKIGITEFPEGSEDKRPCDIYWHNVVYHDINRIATTPNCRVNKFPGMTELAKKISLTHSICSMQRLFPEEYAFYPKSWFLPAHLADFKEYFAKEVFRVQKTGAEQPWFIVKPDEGAQGTGIYLINSPSQLQNISQRQLVQEYIADPFLMTDRLKFDFRVYGVIRSINPLSIYVAREGMARFCTEKYEKPTSSNFENLYAHLTNYSLNKVNDAYIHSNSLQDQIKGSKRLLSTVFHQLEARGLRTKRLWHDIKLIIVKTVLAMLPEIMLHYEHHFMDQPGPQCFQIMGFDIMMKANGEPMLLEVNAAPSLSIDHQLPSPGRSLQDYGSDAPRVRSVVDEVIKIPLVRDTLLLVLNMLDQEYGMSNRSSNSASSNDNSNIPGKTQDDMGTLKEKTKPHLSEIFPNRYGQHSGHLLFLDKAVYLFMQFVNLRITINITNTGLKQFIKKCNLSNVVSPQEEVDAKMAEIHYFFTGDPTTLSTGLSFHGFLQFLFFVAERKFTSDESILTKMQRLLTYCDTSLRHYGVRSARLRRSEVDTNSRDHPVEIYMLPMRMRNKKRSKSSTFSTSKARARTDRNNNPNGAFSLPRISHGY